MNVQLPDLCHIDGNICDRKCGFGAHATVRRANKCVSCETGLVPLTDTEDKWDNQSFYCPKCSPNKETIVTIRKEKVIDLPEDPADAMLCDSCQ